MVNDSTVRASPTPGRHKPSNSSSTRHPCEMNDGVWPKLIQQGKLESLKTACVGIDLFKILQTRPAMQEHHKLIQTAVGRKLSCQGRADESSPAKQEDFLPFHRCVEAQICSTVFRIDKAQA